MKRCNDCKKEKPLDEFYNWKYAKDGKSYKCKKCTSIYYKNKRKLRFKTKLEKWTTLKTLSSDFEYRKLVKDNWTEYCTWANMKARCNNVNHPSYRHYGERGIKVSKRWKYFFNFLKDMGKRPDELSIERINNNKGYSLKNCKWATSKEQGNNRRQLPHRKKTLLKLFNNKCNRLENKIKHTYKWLVYCVEKKKIFLDMQKCANYLKCTKEAVRLGIKQKRKILNNNYTVLKYRDMCNA